MSVKGAERTLILTDICVIDIAVYQKGNDPFRMFVLADSIRRIRELQQFSLLKETDCFLKGQSFM